MTAYRKEYEHWLDSPTLSEEEWKELHDIRNDDEEIRSRFYEPLSFGTAGLRGTMKTGLHHMNVHVIRHATQAFADVVRNSGRDFYKNGVVICHDCRHHSREFAVAAACVMAANGISVRLFEDLRPTPELSFAIRYYGAAAGINITASHNTKEYNGYKVYWSDGAQLPPSKADEIARRMEKNDIFQDFKTIPYEEAVQGGLIKLIGSETDEAYLAKVLAQSVNPALVSEQAEKLKIVYTPFHGAGHRLVPEALRRLGITQLYPVPEQMILDGDFPTVKSPNPENPEGFALAVSLANKASANLIIGTDPDSDRIGVLVRNGSDFCPITGNQLGVLLINYLITAKKENGTLPDNAAIIKTIVTTELARVIAESNGVHAEETFTGFKFMAERIAEWEKTGEYEYIIAYEESYGYMMGDYVRDKDAVTASVLVTEMAAWYLKHSMTLLDGLNKIYETYGYFLEKTISLVMPGVDGIEKMSRMMQKLRQNPLTVVGSVPVSLARDYLTGTISVPELGRVGETPISGSNVLYYELAEGSSFIIRPSGTEPKIKIYLLIRGKDSFSCEQKLDDFLSFAESLRERLGE